MGPSSGPSPSPWHTDCLIALRIELAPSPAPVLTLTAAALVGAERDLMKKFLALFLLLQTFSAPDIAQADSFDYNVLGVIASSQTQKGVALVKSKSSGKVMAYREGQEIAPNVKITRIHRKIVTFVMNEKTYDLRVGDDAPTEVQAGVYSPSGGNFPSNLHQAEGIEKDGNTLKVTKALKESLTGENLNKVLMQAAAVPFVSDGRLVGFQLLEIDPGSIFDIAGIRNGDVITHINEQPINDAALAIRALNALKSSSSAKFSYLRGGKTEDLLIQIN